MGIYITILEQGLIYGILALGVYITYKILDFPDLTVDGSFPLGAALTATMITKGKMPEDTWDKRQKCIECILKENNIKQYLDPAPEVITLPA